MSRFESVSFYEKQIHFAGQDYNVGILVGFHSQGAFAGSRACLKGDSPWMHAAVEASRNFKNYNYAVRNKDFQSDNNVRQRAVYFGSHMLNAVRQIEIAKIIKWPTPQVRLIKSYNTKISGVFLWRCILHDWVGWHLGDEKRFVY